MIYLDKPYALVKWDDALKCVRVDWKGYVDGAEHREVLETILVALTARKGTKLLADARGMRAVTPEDQAWLANEWVPRSNKAGLKHSAVIVPKSMVAKLSLQRMINRGVPVPGADATSAAYFDNEADAERWMRSR